MAIAKPTALPEMCFHVVSTGCIIKLVRLRERENGAKLPRPIYEFAYQNRTGNRANAGNDKPNFTTYIEEINHNTSFKLWISYTII